MSTMARRMTVVWVAAAAALGISGLLGVSPASATTTYSVTSLNDSGPGSLRATIASAGSGDTIAFAPSLSGTITLTSGAITFDKDLTIQGPGASTLTIDGNHNDSIFGIFGGAVSISGLTLANGAAPTLAGGAISDSSNGLLSLDHVVATGNTANNNSGGGGAGGAISVSGAVSVSDSTFTANTAGGSGGSGFSSGEGAGGAIFASGAVSVSDSTFIANTAGGNGGSGGFSGEGFGGAIDAFGAVSVSDSTFTANTAGGSGGRGGVSGIGFGGAIDGHGTVSDSTFTANTAGGSGGSGNSSGRGIGGAINGSGTVSDSTFTANTAGGNTGTARAGGQGSGGAIDANGSLTLDSDTIDANSAGTAPGSAGGGIVQARNVTANGTIMSGNLAGGASSNCDAHVASSDHSLEGPANQTSCGFDLTSADPLLGALADNGGPTQTQALGPYSPALDAIPAASCPTMSDQRGLPRPDGSERTCDVGAYENQDLTITNLGEPDPVLSGHQLTYTITATNTGGQAASGVTVSNVLPASVHFDSMATTQGTCTRTTTSPPKTKGGTVSCTVGDLAVGASATVTIVVTATKPGTLSDTATVSATGTSPDTDDSATATTTVTGT